MNANDARRMVNDYRKAREEEMIAKARNLREEADKAIESQAKIGGHVTFISLPLRGVKPHLVQMLTDDGFAIETTNDGNLRVSW